MKKFWGILVLLVLVSPSMAFAHERQVFDVAGTKYLWTVGSLGEPTFVDQKSGVDLRVKLADPKNPGDGASIKAMPVEGLEATLKVEIAAGGKKRVFDLSPAYKDPGAYSAIFFPTVATTYSYRFFGTLGNAPIDVTFTCNPAGHPKSTDDTSVVAVGDGVNRTLKAGSFGCPQARPSAEFPEKTGSMIWFYQWIERARWMGGIALVLSLVNLVWLYRTTRGAKSA